MNNYLWLIPIIVTFISIFICIIKKKQIEKEYKLELEKQYAQYREEKYQSIHKQIEEERNRYEYELNVLKQSIKSEESKRDSIIQREKEIVDSSVRLYRTQKFNEVDWEKAQALTKLFDEIAQKKTEEQNKLQKILEEINKEKEISQSEIQKIQEELKEYQSKRDAINQEILRSRAIEEKQDFYRVQLDENAKHDIQVLNSIRNQITKTDLLDKLIYDNYISKPVNEMVKRVLEGRAPSGVYKITRLKTGEVYVGQSVDAKARWIQHSKSAWHCGTISHSVLHTTMEKDGIENFTWEFLEEVPKDKLREREKYWISFYDTKNYGLNEKEG